MTFFLSSFGASDLKVGNQKIIYRISKPSNIVMSSSDRDCVLGDMGCANDPELILRKAWPGAARPAMIKISGDRTILAEKTPALLPPQRNYFPLMAPYTSGNLAGDSAA